MKTIIKNDIINMLISMFDKTDSSVLYFRKGKFYTKFISEYPLKYQINDSIIISSNYLVKLVKEMNICSKFKFKKSRIKRYKFLRTKIIHYEN